MLLCRVRTHALRLRLVYFMRRLLFVALTAGLLSPTAAIADTYDALCNNNDCQITINDSGLKGPQGFIAKDNITQWHSFKIALGTAGVINGGSAGLAAATAACFTGVFCPVAIAVGVALARRLPKQCGEFRRARRGQCVNGPVRERPFPGR